VFTLTALVTVAGYRDAMIGPIKNANIRPGESATQFTERAERMLAEANRWMAFASPTMTWMEALYFSIECMRQRQNGVVLPEIGTALT